MYSTQEVDILPFELANILKTFNSTLYVITVCNAAVPCGFVCSKTASLALWIEDHK